MYSVPILKRAFSTVYMTSLRKKCNSNLSDVFFFFFNCISIQLDKNDIFKISQKFKYLFCPMPFQTCNFFKINNCARSYVHQETVFTITCRNQITDVSIKDDFVGFSGVFLRKALNCLLCSITCLLVI